MVQHLAHNWWAWLLRGIAAILLGIAAFAWPGLTFTVLVLFFGAFAFWDGLVAVVSALVHRGQNNNWWLLLFEGLLGILVGLIAFFLPGVAVLAMIYIIAAWAILTGILEIAAALYLRREMRGEWMMVLAGILSIIFGILVGVFPTAGIVAVAWTIGAYAILFGIVEIILSVRLRGYAGRAQTQQVARPV